MTEVRLHRLLRAETDGRLDLGFTVMNKHLFTCQGLHASGGYSLAKRDVHPVFIRLVNRFRVIQTERVETQCPQGSRSLTPKSRQRSLRVPKPIS